MNRKQRRAVRKKAAWKKIGPLQDPVKLTSILAKFRDAIVPLEQELTAHAERIKASAKDHERLAREAAAHAGENV